MTFTPEVWDGVVRRLRSELPSHICDAFIDNLAVEAGDEGITVGCPTAFHRDRVRDQYRKSICAWLAAELGHAVSVEIVVADGGEMPPSYQAAQRAPVSSAAPSPPATAPSDPVPAAPLPRRTEIPRLSASLPAETEALETRAHAPAPLVPRSARKPIQRPLLRAPHTFDSFVVGQCNALAREASLAILRDEDPRLDQLYLCGASGLGKTHLAKAVFTEARARGRRPVYTSAEAFTNEFLASLRNRQTGRFKRKVRKECDVLVVEDVGFLAGKESTQLEFFHTVQHVRDAGGRVVFTAGRLPQAFAELDARVRSQLSDGFVAEMGAPDAGVRRDILRAKAAAGGVHLPPDCLEMLVESVRGSVRDLESVLIQLVTTASLLKKKIDPALTREALDKKGAETGTLPRLQIADVLTLVAASFQISTDEMAGRSRKKEVLVPRQLGMYLCRRYTDASLAEIGRALNRDHPSVRNAIRKVERAILEKAPLRYQVEELVRQIVEKVGSSEADPSCVGPTQLVDSSCHGAVYRSSSRVPTHPGPRGRR